VNYFLIKRKLMFI